MLKNEFLFIAALFDAVEQQDLDQVKFILENNSLDLNRLVNFCFFSSTFINLQ